MSTFLGVDAGGTKTAVLLAAGEKIVARATGGAGAVRAGRALQAASRITVAVRRALNDAGLLHADVLVVGAAGVGREPERTELRESLRGERLAEKVIVTGDLDIAMEAAFGQGPGIVLISGTGSVAVGRSTDGKVHRRGGYGWQMGDEGSGYAIARAGMMAVGQAQDGRGKPTSLSKSLLTQGAATSFDELVRWSTSAETGEIAALAPRVFQAADEGDAVATEIVARAAEDLAALVTALLPVYEKGAAIPVALAGGNLSEGRALRDPVMERLRKSARLKVQEHQLEPALGALALARRAI